MKRKTQQTPFAAFTATREAAGITSGHVAAWAVHQARQARQARPAVVDDLKRKRHTIAVLMATAERAAVEATRPRVKRWSQPVNTSIRAYHHTVRDTDAGKYSNRCTFHKIDHSVMAWSECWITCTGRYMVYQYGPKQTVIKAPRGWKWAVDENGPHIINTAGDAEYHLDSLDLTLPDRGYPVHDHRERSAGQVPQSNGRDAQHGYDSARPQRHLHRGVRPLAWQQGHCHRHPQLHLRRHAAGIV